MKRRRAAVTIALLVLSLAGGVGVVRGAESDDSRAAIAANVATLHDYCQTCHNPKLNTAGLTLTTLDLDRVGEQAETWEKVVRKLRTQSMPPPGAPRPDAASYDRVATFLET